MCVLIVVLFVFGQIRRYAGGRIAWDVDYDLRNAVFAHLQGLDFARHDELQTGQLVSRTNSDLQLVRQLFNQAPNILSNVLQFVLSLGIMFVLSPLLAAATLPFVPILFWFSLRMRRRVYPSQWEAQARMAEVIGQVDAATTGVRVVKGFGQERREFNRVLDALRILFASRMRNLRLRARRTSTLQALPQFTQVIILGIGGYLAFHHDISIGTLVAFMTYLALLAAPARQLGSVIVTAQQARAGAERVLELLDSLPDVTEKADAVTLPPPSTGASASTGCRSATCGRSRSCVTSPWRSLRVRRSGLSARRARGSRRSGSCSLASTTSSPGTSGSKEWTCAT